MKRYFVPLQCSSCGIERVHAVAYIGHVIASIRCLHCSETYGPVREVLIGQYVRDFELRLVQKPGKMLHHAKQRPVDFLFHYLPQGLVCKPLEVLSEWEVLARTISTRSLDDNEGRKANISK
jgi:hypothetical protein